MPSIRQLLHLSLFLILQPQLFPRHSDNRTRIGVAFTSALPHPHLLPAAGYEGGNNSGGVSEYLNEIRWWPSSLRILAADAGDKTNLSDRTAESVSGDGGASPAAAINRGWRPSPNSIKSAGDLLRLRRSYYNSLADAAENNKVDGLQTGGTGHDDGDTIGAQLDYEDGSINVGEVYTHDDYDGYEEEDAAEGVSRTVGVVLVGKWKRHLIAGPTFDNCPPGTRLVRNECREVFIEGTP